MNVLLTVGIYPPDIGGPATFIPKLAERIIVNGGKSHVIALSAGASTQKSTSYKLTFVPRSTPLKRFVKCSCSILIGAIHVDKVFSNGLYLESTLALRLLRKKSVAKIVGDPIWERLRNLGETNLPLKDFQAIKLPLRYRIFRRIYNFSLNSYTVITCPSNELVEIVRGWGVKRPVIYIPNGVQVPEKINEVKDFDLIYVGRLVPWKNVEAVISIAAVAHLKTLIVGSGPLEQQLKMLSVHSGANCIFVGEQSPGKVSEYLNRSKAFILLSEYEGLSFALLEAMAHGLPAIVSNAKGNTDVITDQVNGVVLDLSDLGSRNQELIMLLSDDSKLSRMGSQARDTVNCRFEADKQLDKFLELLG
ncbi:RfaG Glycosyltransferase [Candidatus Nanopelagicaceae bacterium]